MAHNVLKFVHICHVKNYALLACHSLTIFCTYIHTVLKRLSFFSCIYINLTLNKLEIDCVYFSVLLYIFKNGKETWA